MVLSNQGDIDAVFHLLPSQTTFGPRFQFSPSEGIVTPGGHQAVKIAFSSPMLGDFDEDFRCSVRGLPEELQLNFRGNVIGPTFHFDQPKLKFGTVSYGECQSLLLRCQWALILKDQREALSILSDCITVQ